MTLRLKDLESLSAFHLVSILIHEVIYDYQLCKHTSVVFFRSIVYFYILHTICIMGHVFCTHVIVREPLYDGI